MTHRESSLYPNSMASVTVTSAVPEEIYARLMTYVIAEATANPRRPISRSKVVAVALEEWLDRTEAKNGRSRKEAGRAVS